MEVDGKEAQIKLRLPLPLKQQLKNAAERNRRTLIREIEHRLAQSVEQEVPSAQPT